MNVTLLWPYPLIVIFLLYFNELQGKSNLSNSYSYSYSYLL